MRELIAGAASNVKAKEYRPNRVSRSRDAAGAPAVHRGPVYECRSEVLQIGMHSCYREGEPFWNDRRIVVARLPLSPRFGSSWRSTLHSPFGGRGERRAREQLGMTRDFGEEW